MTTTYNTGTISVSNGSTTVMGVGTNWIAGGILPGDDFRAAGLTVEIASVNSATSITLARAWPGAGQAAANYSIRLIDEGERSLAALNEIISALGSGNLSSFAGLEGASNKMAYFTGAGTLAVADLTVAARALLARAAIEQANPTDATAGRLLAVGAFGLGATVLTSVTDLNAALLNGWYSYGLSALNRPFVNGGTVLVLSPNASRVAQIAIEHNSGKIATRYVSEAPPASGVWQPWDEFVTASTLNGFVSVEEITVADDAVGVVDLPGSRTSAMAIIQTSLASNGDVQNVNCGVVMLDAGPSPAGFSVYSGTSFSVTSTTLTGTSGTDGRTTVAPKTSGQLQIENRGGASRKYRVTFL
ncbi:hypothetical protein rosmuc_03067 [Roseovarius mucosus DSM 17069]|uniref:Uncharacterized protein n=1 Tax=Roseovarius mucosus DSM 17069 TaxID=1288298 RepID=A0A0A0HJD8_9RHOB|nr:pyocin knob domain-containing protein [Roseovarius mucosus]KGM86774.1 hypothetical protein rosmuc_03067 [Roseovarius mucosus DSM 17069]